MKSNFKFFASVVAVLVILFILGNSYRQAKVDQQQKAAASREAAKAQAIAAAQAQAAKAAAAVQQQSEDRVVKVYVVGADPVRVDIPIRYRLECDWGHAPLDTRTNANPEWTDATKRTSPHTNGGTMVEWREFRMNHRYDGTAKLTAVLIKDS